MGTWQAATVVAAHDETARARTLRLALTQPEPHLAGQHYVVRLRAPDGYTAQRSYSVASAPPAAVAGSASSGPSASSMSSMSSMSSAVGGAGTIDLTVERLDDGEVSGYLHDVVEVGDELEVRGPIGGWFVWRGDTPALLVGGGSGIVPLMSMLRLARRAGRSDLVHLVVSVRSPADLYYADELPGPEVTVVYTREAPPADGVDPVRPPGRLMASDLAHLVRPDLTAYVCGSARFADAASRLVVAAGVPVDAVRVERFGPTG